MAYHLFTSESVTEGHPDKVCDQISDAILDTILAEDPNARVACETLATTGLVLVSGEISTKCYVDISRVVRNTLRKIGYSQGRFGFDADTCSVLSSIGEQSPDIALGVDKSLEAKLQENMDEILAPNERAEIGAGDQGMMFGYATNETPAFMPMPIFLAHALSRRLAEVRKNGLLGYLGPDGKTQVTVAYENGQPQKVESVVISTQHMPEIALAQIDVDLRAHVIKSILPPEMIHDDMKCYINPTGRFVVGGPEGDTGLTGRKIIVDTYGGMARHGGGAFSGKDPTKVDRSACYAARYIAKNIVAAGLADRCEIQLAYAIGVARPVSIAVDTFGTGKVNEEAIGKLVNKCFDLRPAAIIESLDLRRPIYQETAAYGHFGRLDLDLPWEKTDKAVMLREEAGI